MDFTRNLTWQRGKKAIWKMAKKAAGTTRCSMQIGRLSTRWLWEEWNVLGLKMATKMADLGSLCESREEKATAGSVIYVIHQVADMFQKGRLVPLHNGSVAKVSSGPLVPTLARWDKNIGLKKIFQVWTKSSKSVLSEFSHRPKIVQRNDH